MKAGAPRLYYIHTPAAGRLPDWPPLLDHCAELGFDHVQLAPIFAPALRGGIFVTGDPERVHPSLGVEGTPTEAVAHIADLCAPRGLTLVLDISLDRTASGTPSDEEPPDPRRDPLERGAVSVDFHSEIGRRHLDGWRRRIGALAEAGAGGFCFHGLKHLPDDALKMLADAAKAAGARAFAWTPGLPHERLEALSHSGLDAVFSSLRWWSHGSGWFLHEHDMLRRAASSIAFPEAPFEGRLAAEFSDGSDRHRAARRALWLCAALGDGLMVPMGFEYGARRPLHRAEGAPPEGAGAGAWPPGELAADIEAVNALLAEDGGRFARQPMIGLTGPGGSVSAVLRMDAGTITDAEAARLVLVNWNLGRPAHLRAAEILKHAGAAFEPFADLADPTLPPVGPDSTLHLGPGEVRILEARTARPVLLERTDKAVDRAAKEERRIVIEKLEPCLEGDYPIKRCVGDALHVEADIFGDGHVTLRTALRWRACDETEWREAPMRHLVNDRWTADMPLERLGRHQFEVHAWLDEFGTFRTELTKKHAAGQTVTLELEEGRLLVESRLGAKLPKLDTIAERLAEAGDTERLEILLSQQTAELMAEADPRPFTARSRTVTVDAERRRAEFAAWYELFPRSQGEAGRHGTFDDVIARLPAIRAMGFDVLYFPPIHPIGRTNRKGRNNSLTPAPGDPGSPYAIGSEDGGHDAIHPELGTLDDFRRLVAAAAEQGLEVALDFAIQCSPDHPWLKEHPDWFDWRPDGTIRYAENPPKRYEDIVNVDFYASGAVPSLWLSLRDVVLFWVEQGVRLFRVDNPHTKPFPFWEWLIADIRALHPDTIFLAEAFTRPKVMYRLAKIGFSQSYTYFTWRTAKWEITEYLTELTRSEARYFFRPHFFVNTPDINPPYLHGGERSAHLARLALATTLSGLWGMYNGFETCEARPVPGKEEYLDSEKYEIRHWDWNQADSIVPEITRLNRLRRENPALQSHLGVAFHTAHNDNVLFFSKTAAGGNAVLVAVNLAPTSLQEADIELPFGLWSLADHDALDAEDLMRDAHFTWHGKYQRIRLDPADLPFAVWRVRPSGGA